jgi:hypothetical protein
VSRDGALDITVMGLVHLLAFLAVLSRLLWVLRHDRAYWLLCAGALVVLTDVGYAIYWNSFYAEPASCLFFLLLLAEGVEIGRAGQASPASMLRWSLWAALWVFAKPQNTPMGLILAPFTLWMAFWGRSRRAFPIAVAGSCAMLGCAAYNVLAMPRVGHMANTYGMVFAGILPESKDKAADLRALGLDPQLAKYSGSGAWTPNTAFTPLVQSGVLERKVTTFSILRFYLLRPPRLWRRLHVVLPHITFLRNWYGNYEPSSGFPPSAQSRSFTLWSDFHERVLPVFSKWIVFALAGWPPIAAWIWMRERDSLRRKHIALLTLLPVCCLAALMGAVFGDAFDLIKHMYLFNLLLDTCMVCAAAAGWKAVVRLRRSRRERSGASPVLRGRDGAPIERPAAAPG